MKPGICSVFLSLPVIRLIQELVKYVEFCFINVRTVNFYFFCLCLLISPLIMFCTYYHIPIGYHNIRAVSFLSQKRILHLKETVLLIRLSFFFILSCTKILRLKSIIFQPTHTSREVLKYDTVICWSF